MLLFPAIANIFCVPWSTKVHEVHHQPVRYRHCDVRANAGRTPTSSFHLDFAARGDQSVGLCARFDSSANFSNKRLIHLLSYGNIEFESMRNLKNRLRLIWTLKRFKCLK